MHAITDAESNTVIAVLVLLGQDTFKLMVRREWTIWDASVDSSGVRAPVLLPGQELDAHLTLIWLIRLVMRCPAWAKPRTTR
jgi:hypothetical protein